MVKAAPNVAPVPIDPAVVLQALLGDAQLWFLFRQANAQSLAVFEFKTLPQGALYGLDLSGYDFSDLDLRGLDLSGIELMDANFDRSDLARADFQEAKVQRATFKDADLSDADFRRASGVNAHFFAGADLSRAKFDDGAVSFSLLDAIPEIAKNGGKVFLAMLGATAYALLTTFSVNDVQIISNQTMTPLPILGTEVPIQRFFLIAPLVLVGTLIYFHIYLLQLWQTMSTLPAYLPDGSSIVLRAYPWLPNGMVQHYLRRLRDSSEPSNNPALKPIWRWLQIGPHWPLLAVGWIAPPLALACMTLRFLPSRNIVVISTLLVVFAFTVCMGSVTLQRGAIILRKVSANQGELVSRSIRSLIFCGFTVVLLGVICMMSLTCLPKWTEFDEQRAVSSSAIAYQLQLESARLRQGFLDQHFLTWNTSQGMLEALGIRGYADLRGMEVSKRESEPGKDYENVKGASLREATLMGATLERAFIARCDMSETRCFGANFDGADCSYVNFDLADLRNCSFSGARLKRAIFREANIAGAQFDSAYGVNSVFDECRGFLEYKVQRGRQKAVERAITQFESTNLASSSFDNSILQHARFSLCTLDWANFSEAHLEDADLTLCSCQEAVFCGAQMERITAVKADFTRAKFGPKPVKTDPQSELTGPADLTDATLSQSDFTDADMRRVSLQGATLFGATLLRTDLRDAHLLGAKGLREDQLRRCILNEGTILDSRFDELKAQVIHDLKIKEQLKAKQAIEQARDLAQALRQAKAQKIKDDAKAQVYGKALSSPPMPGDGSAR